MVDSLKRYLSSINIRDFDDLDVHKINVRVFVVHVCIHANYLVERVRSYLDL